MQITNTGLLLGLSFATVAYLHYRQYQNKKELRLRRTRKFLDAAPLSNKRGSIVRSSSVSNSLHSAEHDVPALSRSVSSSSDISTSPPRVAKKRIPKSVSSVNLTQFGDDETSTTTSSIMYSYHTPTDAVPDEEFTHLHMPPIFDETPRLLGRVAPSEVSLSMFLLPYAFSKEGAGNLEE